VAIRAGREPHLRYPEGERSEEGSWCGSGSELSDRALPFLSAGAPWNRHNSSTSCPAASERAPGSFAASASLGSSRQQQVSARVLRAGAPAQAGTSLAGAPAEAGWQGSALWTTRYSSIYYTPEGLGRFKIVLVDAPRGKSKIAQNPKVSSCYLACIMTRTVLWDLHVVGFRERLLVSSNRVFPSGRGERPDIVGGHHDLHPLETAFGVHPD
jgi:hypothetical protein